ncbi:phage tail spike protein [Vaginisenegalia massiliensis]|uniref:phage tail spike protein n=1 Tax=Vaginisenegalia massiliensis TaxID=2058294 RepID=UPI0013DDBCED|nr:phage tail spike protein [Vaginisenegalia massiliensis]
MRCVLNRKHELIGILDNDSESGVSYFEDQLGIRSEDGFFTGSFSVDKDDKADFIQEGNFVTFLNSRGERLLTTIMKVETIGNYKTCEIEDIGLDLINGYAEDQTMPEYPQDCKWYLENALEGTGWEIGINETTEALRLEFTTDQTILERIQAIVKAFGARPRYTCEFDGFKVTKRLINLYVKNKEKKEIRIDSDFHIEGIKRTVDMFDFATRVIASGSNTQTQLAQKETEEKQATPVAKSNWSPKIIDRRNEAMGGQSVDRPLSQITHIAIHYTAVARSVNKKIWQHEDYWRSAHGWDRGGYHYYIDSQGVLYHNYNYERITWGVLNNNDYTVHVSVEANSAADYSEEQLRTREWIVRKMMADLNIPAKNVWGHKEFPGNEGNSCPGYTKAQLNEMRERLSKPANFVAVETPQPVQSDDMYEKAIREAEKLIGVPYAWGGVSNRGFDCSGLCILAFRRAGFNIPGRPTTYTFWGQQGPYKRVANKDRQRGDLVLMDTVGAPPGHVGIYIGDNKMLHTGGPNGVPMRGPVSLSSFRVMGYVRVLKP